MKYILAPLLALSLNASAEEKKLPNYFDLHYKNDYDNEFILRLHPNPCNPQNPDDGYLSQVIDLSNNGTAYGCWRHEESGVRLFIMIEEGKYIDYPVLMRDSFEPVYE